MIYVFDSSSLMNLFNNFYLGRFPSLWRKFEDMADTGDIISVREVYKEIEERGDRLSEWAGSRKDFFAEPLSQELDFVAEIFRNRHFQTLVNNKARLQGKPVADSFIIAKARQIEGSVVTQELKKPNAARIPNVCEYFGIPYMNLEGFMERENWTF